MGIPVGWNVTRDEAKDQDVLRGDVTGSRSPIRRRARGSRRARSPPLAVFDTDALVDGSATYRHAARLSHARTQLPPAPPVPGPRDDYGYFDRVRLRLRPHARHADRAERADGADGAEGTAPSERRLPALTPGFAPARLRPQHSSDDAVASLRHPDRALTSFGHDNDDHDDDDVSAGRERRRYFTGVASRWGSPFTSSSARHTAPGHVEQHAPPPLHDDAADATVPASSAHMRPPRPYARPARLGDRPLLADNDDNDDNDTPDTAVSFPPLRRVGHRRIPDAPLPASSLRESWSPVSTLDGLGDRERSNSVSSTSSNLPWNTFLSTVVPDPVAPTAESSFASAAASASFTASSSRASSSNSAASSRTHLTVPSRRASPPPNETFMRACDTSDEDTASDTEDEAQASVLSRRRMRPSYFADEPPTPERHSRRVLQRSRDASAYVRSFYSNAQAADEARIEQPDGPIDIADEPTSFETVEDDVLPATGLSSPLDQELRDARSLLERLTRRDDVSDDFWASVGLTRSFADGVERVQERGRF